MNGSKNKTLRILDRDKWKCVYCNAPLDKTNAQMDHVYPKVRGGDNSEGNLASTCPRCNAIKGDLILDEFLSKALKRKREAAEALEYYSRIAENVERALKR